MKSLIIFYSFEGNTKFIANVIKEEINADILELRPKKEIKSKGFMKYFRGGHAVIMKQTPELLPFQINPNDYELIFIGTPVWAWNYAPPINTFFSTVKVKNKKIALFCCHEGCPRKTLWKMKKSLIGNKIIGAMDFKAPLKFDKRVCEIKAKKWANEVLRKSNEKI